MEIRAFYLDKYPVTNAQFKRFLDASGYRPNDDYNFLEDWKNGTYPAGWDKQAGHLGVASRTPGPTRRGRQASAARMGMAVRGAGHRRAARIPGAASPTPRLCPSRKTAASRAAHATWTPIPAAPVLSE